MRRERIKRPVTTLLDLFSQNCTKKFYLVSTTNLPLHLAPLISLNQPWHPSLPASLKSTILLGDFNINLLLPDNQIASELASVLSAFHLTQVVDQPTCVTANSSSLIGHVYISDPALLHSCSIAPSLGDSDHLSFLPLHQQVWKYSQAHFEDASNAVRDQSSSSLP